MAKQINNRQAQGIADWALKAWDRVTQFWALITSITGGGVVTVATFFTDWMDKWGWLGLAVASIGSACAIFVLLSIAKAALSSAREKRARADYLEASTVSNASVNPLSDVFRNEIIKINDLFVPWMQVLQSKSFKDCHIQGPGFIGFLDGCQIRQPFLDHCNFVVIDVRKKPFITGLVAFKDSHFENCAFINITFIIDEKMAQSMKQQPKMGDIEFIGFDYEKK